MEQSGDGESDRGGEQQSILPLVSPSSSPGYTATTRHNELPLFRPILLRVDHS
ncbi:hypothetical protein RISK_001463 [Rhodopirellula islandica]|uniref:Uncharacterized protein n=1 Tax=Rhodopirellula islandica TaxID=595434 RepID=A0A0J1BI82_RHOIS|nr:hypothetical protein RISK_001463 [Rhodopirellula islandica]